MTTDLKLDVRMPIGALFAADGLVLAAYGMAWLGDASRNRRAARWVLLGISASVAAIAAGVLGLHAVLATWQTAARKMKPACRRPLKPSRESRALTNRSETIRRRCFRSSAPARMPKADP